MRKEKVQLRVSSQRARRPGVGLRPVSASVDATRELERSRCTTAIPIVSVGSILVTRRES